MTQAWLTYFHRSWANRRSRRHARAASAREERSSAERWQWGYAVRADWPDGTHTLTAWHHDIDSALRKLRRQRAYWRSAPITPTWNLVPANRDLVRQHQDLCQSSRCPNETVVDPRN